MRTGELAGIAFLNVLVAALIVAGHAHWFAQKPPRLAVLDVAELYRLKETQVTTLLVRGDLSTEARARALGSVGTFGTTLAEILKALPDECHCLVLSRGAVVGAVPDLPDLTPDVRRRLGL